MYLSLYLAKSEDVSYEDIDQMAQNAPEMMKGVKGYVNGIVFSNKDTNEFGVIGVFETKEDLEADWKSRTQEAKDGVMKYGTRSVYYVNRAYSAE